MGKGRDTSTAIWTKVKNFQVLIMQYNFRILRTMEMEPNLKESSLQEETEYL